MRQRGAARPWNTAALRVSGPATQGQLATFGGRADRYDRDLRPSLVIRVIADHQAAGIEAAIWKVKGLKSANAACGVVAQIRAGSAPGQCARARP